MKWFQHDSGAHYNKKIKKLILKHGTDGYAIYWHCIELIAGNINSENITFELEHDAEIICDNLRVKGSEGEAAIDKVNRILRTIVELNLFTETNNRLFCYKLAERLDNTVSRNPEINKIKQLINESNVDTTKLLRSDNVDSPSRSDQIRSDQNRLDNNENEISKETSNKSILEILKSDPNYNKNSIYLLNTYLTNKLAITKTSHVEKQQVKYLEYFNSISSGAKRYSYRVIMHALQSDMFREDLEDNGFLKENHFSDILKVSYDKCKEQLRFNPIRIYEPNKNKFIEVEDVCWDDYKRYCDRMEIPVGDKITKKHIDDYLLKNGSWFPGQEGLYK